MRAMFGLLAALFVTANAASAGGCGKVTISEMNWDSARVIANIEKIVLQAGFGCDVTLVRTTTVPGLNSHIERGTPDIISEIWVNSVRSAFEKGIASGRIVQAGRVLSEGGLESWWIPAYLANAHPDLRTVEDLRRKWRLFEHPDAPGKGRFHTCPKGWGCRIINANMFKAYGLGDTFVAYDPKSGDGLKASIASAYERRLPWVGYYWAPTAILGRYPMVPLKLRPFSRDGHTCNQKSDCEKPHAGSYPASRVVSSTTAAFRRSHPEEFAFVAKISIPNKIMNSVLAWGEKNRGGGVEMAGHFLRSYTMLWKTWLPPEIAERVEAGL